MTTNAAVRRQLRTILGPQILGMKCAKTDGYDKASLISQLSMDDKVVSSLKDLYTALAECCPAGQNTYDKDPAMGDIWYTARHWDQVDGGKKAAFQSFLEVLLASKPFKHQKGSCRTNQMQWARKYKITSAPRAFRERKPTHGGEEYLSQPVPSDTRMRHVREKQGDALIPSNLSSEQGKGDLLSTAHPDAFMSNDALPKEISIHDAMTDIANAEPPPEMKYVTKMKGHSTRRDQKLMQKRPTQHTAGYQTPFSNLPPIPTYSSPTEAKRSRAEAMVEAANSELSTGSGNVTQSGQKMLNVTTYMTVGQGTGGKTQMGGGPGTNQVSDITNGGIVVVPDDHEDEDKAITGDRKKIPAPPSPEGNSPDESEALHFLWGEEQTKAKGGQPGQTSAKFLEFQSKYAHKSRIGMGKEEIDRAFQNLQTDIDALKHSDSIKSVLSNVVRLALDTGWIPVATIKGFIKSVPEDPEEAQKWHDTWTRTASTPGDIVRNEVSKDAEVAQQTGGGRTTTTPKAGQTGGQPLQGKGRRMTLQRVPIIERGGTDEIKRIARQYIREYLAREGPEAGMRVLWRAISKRGGAQSYKYFRDLNPEELTQLGQNYYGSGWVSSVQIAEKNWLDKYHRDNAGRDEAEAGQTEGGATPAQTAASSGQEQDHFTIGGIGTGGSSTGQGTLNPKSGSSGQSALETGSGVRYQGERWTKFASDRTTLAAKMKNDIKKFNDFNTLVEINEDVLRSERESKTPSAAKIKLLESIIANSKGSRDRYQNEMEKNQVELKRITDEIKPLRNIITAYNTAKEAYQNEITFHNNQLKGFNQIRDANAQREAREEEERRHNMRLADLQKSIDAGNEAFGYQVNMDAFTNIFDKLTGDEEPTDEYEIAEKAAYFGTKTEKKGDPDEDEPMPQAEPQQQQQEPLPQAGQQQQQQPPPAAREGRRGGAGVVDEAKHGRPFRGGLMTGAKPVAAIQPQSGGPAQTGQSTEGTSHQPRMEKDPETGERRQAVDREGNPLVDVVGPGQSTSQQPSVGPNAQGGEAGKAQQLGGRVENTYTPTLRLFFKEGDANIVPRINDNPIAKAANREVWYSFDAYDWEANDEDDNDLRLHNLVEEARRFYGPLDMEELLPQKAQQATQEQYNKMSKEVFSFPPFNQPDAFSIQLDIRGGAPLTTLTAEETEATFHDVYLKPWIEIPESSPWKRMTQMQGTQMSDSQLRDPLHFHPNDQFSDRYENAFIYTTDS